MEKTLLLKIFAGIAGFAGPPSSLLLIYVLNGIFWDCWSDPTAAAVACKGELPNLVSEAVTSLWGGSITVIATALASMLSGGKGT